MRIIIYSTKEFEKEYLLKANTTNHELVFVIPALSADTSALAKGCEAAMIFTSDDASAKPLEALKQNGIKYIATRAAGYDNIDIKKASDLRLKVSNVPLYSPVAIAEHAVGLMLALNRKLIAADRQVHNFNFSLNNLVGFNLNNKTVGIIGTDYSGAAVAKLLHAFGCRLIAYDPYPDIELTRGYHINYVGLEQLCATSDVITVHTPLNAETKYLINKNAINNMKPGVMLINTARGAVVNTADVLEGLSTGHLGYFGADVYEYEKDVFFFDRSAKIPEDTLLARLLKMPNVIITPHQGFATKESLANTAAACFNIVNCWQNNQPAPNELTVRARGNLYEPSHP